MCIYYLGLENPSRWLYFVGNPRRPSIVKNGKECNSVGTQVLLRSSVVFRNPVMRVGDTIMLTLMQMDMIESQIIDAK